MVKKLGTAAGIDPTFELQPILKTLVDQHLIEARQNGIEVIALTSSAVLQHTADIFSAESPEAQELAAITMAEMCSHRPHTGKELKELLGDRHQLGSRQLRSLLDDTSTVGFSDHEEYSGLDIYFNGSLFRRDEAAKVHLVLSGLSSAEQQKMLEVDAVLSKRTCVAYDEVLKIAKKPLLDKLISVGVYELNEVRNKEEAVVYVTKPSAFCKFGDTSDTFDMAKALVTALTYGMSRSKFSRGRITMVDLLLGKLLRGEWVGPATAIGEDYKILEMRKVIQVKNDRFGFSMKLLKRDVGEIARAAIAQGEASEHSLDLPGVAASLYRGPEEKRVEVRRRATDVSGVGVADILQSLRAGG